MTASTLVGKAGGVDMDRFMLTGSASRGSGPAFGLAPPIHGVTPHHGGPRMTRQGASTGRPNTNRRELLLMKTRLAAAFAALCLASARRPPISPRSSPRPASRSPNTAADAVGRAAARADAAPGRGRGTPGGAGHRASRAERRRAHAPAPPTAREAITLIIAARYSAEPCRSALMSVGRHLHRLGRLGREALRQRLPRSPSRGTRCALAPVTATRTPPPVWRDEHADQREARRRLLVLHVGRLLRRREAHRGDQLARLQRRLVQAGEERVGGDRAPVGVDGRAERRAPPAG